MDSSKELYNKLAKVPISARLVDSPVFDSQVDGFGHYGWENNINEEKS